MMYKTITLGLLQQYPQTDGSRTPMQTLDHYSEALRASHQQWMQALNPASPAESSSEALELAVQDLENHLRMEDGALSLDDAVTFLRRHPPG